MLLVNNWISYCLRELAIDPKSTVSVIVAAAAVAVVVIGGGGGGGGGGVTIRLLKCSQVGCENRQG